MTSEAILIRNFELLKEIFDHLEILSRNYNLNRRDINIIQQFCMNHNSYNAYISIKMKNFTETRRVIYRCIEKLEEKNVIVVANRPINQYTSLDVYFTTDFINNVCSEEFADLYSKWLDWQLEFKKKGEDNV